MSSRIEKANSEIQRCLSNIIHNKMNDPRINDFVSVADVKVTPDFKFCKVIISLIERDFPIYKEIIATLPIKYSISLNEIDVYALHNLEVFVSNDVNLEKDITYSINFNEDELKAPLKYGDIVGTLTIFNDGIILGSTPLIVTKDVERNTFLYTLDMMKEFILSKVFLIIVIFFILLLIIYYTYQNKKFKNMQ